MVLYGRNHTLTALLRDGFRALMGSINTSIPGVVEMYDATTKRARVRPVVQFAARGRVPQNSVPIVDVPVIMPAAGGWVTMLTVKPGDFVQLLFSQRGIANFKRQQVADVPPTAIGFFSLQDAVAMPGWGAETVTPAPGEGIALQNEDGTIYIAVTDTGITVRSDNQPVTIQAGSGNISITTTGNVSINGGNVIIGGTTTVNGKSLADAGAGTNAAAGPGSHSHGLTGA